MLGCFVLTMIFYVIALIVVSRRLFRVGGPNLVPLPLLREL